jgi:hypothetical protein
MLSIGGTAITALSVSQDEATSVDLAIAVTTTTVGSLWGEKPGKSMITGFSVSIIQWIWDHWER